VAIASCASTRRSSDDSFSSSASSSELCGDCVEEAAKDVEEAEGVLLSDSDNIDLPPSSLSFMLLLPHL
jgi:hypothetical protein